MIGQIYCKHHLLKIAWLCIFLPGDILSQTGVKYFLGQEFAIDGIGWQETADNFTRLPLKFQPLVPPEVWRLSQNSAGLTLHFSTNAEKIYIRWKPKLDNHMPHMTDIATKGFDLYARAESDVRWRWAGCSRTWQTGPRYQALLIDELSSATKYCRLYLPLYDGIDSVEIGVPDTAIIQSWRSEYKFPKPIVFYGTSITQGGCASRPGMTYPAIIGREIDAATINLGFSGNGKMEISLAEALAEIDAACYVIDCLPNLTPEMVAERVVPFVQTLRRSRPATPIILVSSVFYDNAWLKAPSREKIIRKNQNLRQAYQELVQHKVPRLILVEPEKLEKVTADGTVDGVHLTDLGFSRMASVLTPVILKVLEK